MMNRGKPHYLMTVGDFNAKVGEKRCWRMHTSEQRTDSKNVRGQTLVKRRKSDVFIAKKKTW